MNKVIDTFMNGKLPSWVHKDERAYKKGGKVKKDKKEEEPKKKPKKKSAKDSGKSSAVSVNIKIGDSVLLRKGNVPKMEERKAKGYVPTGRPIGRPRGSGYKGVPLSGPSGGPEGPLSYRTEQGGNPPVKRFASPGNLYGGGLPGPLQASSYGSAPTVATPLSRVEFIGSSDAYYNRNRNKSDDFKEQVNPSGIEANVRPSIRHQPSSNPNALPSAEYTQYIQHNWYGEMPRDNRINENPSSRAVKSKPSDGFRLTNAPIQIDEEGVGHLDDYKYASASSSSEDVLSQPVMEEIAPKGGKQEAKYSEAQKMQHMKDMVKSEFPTLKRLKEEGGYDTYDEAYESYYEHFADQYKRGGRVRSVF